jgi:serine/threonine-protein kinase RsbW
VNALPDSRETIHISLPSTAKYLNLVGACVSEMIDRIDDVFEPDIMKYNIQLAVQEICINIIVHAYDDNPDKRVEVDLAWMEQARSIVIKMLDTGRPFDITKVVEPDLEEGQVHGYGLFIVKHLMDDVQYSSDEAGNHWTLVKNL